MRLAPRLTRAGTFDRLGPGGAPTRIGKPHLHPGEHTLFLRVVADGGALCLTRRALVTIRVWPHCKCQRFARVELGRIGCKIGTQGALALAKVMEGMIHRFAWMP